MADLISHLDVGVFDGCALMGSDDKYVEFVLVLVGYS